jgi:asparagine synthase (glutamine-hydrolysing)
MHAHGMSTLEEARTLMDVHLSGWDGGTIMGGRLDEYETDPDFRHAPDEAAFTERLYEAFCHTFTWPGLTEAEATALYRSPGCTQLEGRARASFADEIARTAHYPSPYRTDYFYIDQHVRRSTQAMIVFQRSAFEVRCPYFDYDLVTFLYGLPENIYATPALHRAILTRRAPALALVPHDKDDRLPHSNVLMRGSHGAFQRSKRAVNRLAGPIFPSRPRLYADYETYLRTDLRDWGEGILFAPRSIERGLFNPAMVRTLWERHQRGNELWTIGKIAPLITIELVIRALFDDCPDFAVTGN